MNNNIYYTIENSKVIQRSLMEDTNIKLERFGGFLFEKGAFTLDEQEAIIKSINPTPTREADPIEINRGSWYLNDKGQLTCD